MQISRFITRRGPIINKVCVTWIIVNIILAAYFGKSGHNENIDDLFTDYPKNLEKLRKTAFRHIYNTTYLDYTGAGVYSDQTLFQYTEDLKKIDKRNKKKIIDEIRIELLNFLDADPNIYDVVFVASATQALKVVGENFQWSEGSTFAYTKLNHNSVLGIRRYALAANANFTVVENPREIKKLKIKKDSKNLLVFPLEDNFMGTKFANKDITEILKDQSIRRKWAIVGDSAAFLPTNKMSLRQYDFDAIVMSFYKIFGFPNYGALVIKKDFEKQLLKKTYSSNSVKYSNPIENNFTLNSLEDDEPSFELVLAVRHGIAMMNQIGMDRINSHVWNLTKRLYQKIDALSHSNGVKAATIYGNHEMKNDELQGGVVTFNMKRTADDFFGYFQVVSDASAAGFHLRGGCHCNPGGCFSSTGIPEAKVKKFFDAKTTCGDNNDVVDGVPLGAVRASLGWASTEEDVDRFVKWLSENFVF